ncbi:hypothetical protein N7541_008785 [Penicillium brevicompactum]|uniref:Phosphoribulokinase/uridine kinase domain-containing protein n=1 Tax=Penicillium brevicompactum TaxID=5074 RepID=A0A9W9U9V8_PENBR|nr:hypothetical protein N7452_008069 [Penicillium brevicompactum]KAJ5346303.1 hypothetical protein N7541_008785 [Penicillium brevicompactum]
MDIEYRKLADAIRSQADAHPKPRFLVAIAGIPGSGKTTTAEAVVHNLNQSAVSRAALLSMDGFHFSRAALDGFPDPTNAHARRGAPWTFDVNRFVAFIHRLREWADKMPLAMPYSETWSSAEMIHAPSFDHQSKDPVENGLTITPDASIIVIEGNYLLLDDPGWRELAGMVDYRVYVDTDPLEARDRLAVRHLQAGIEKSLEDGYRRVDSNDYLNAIHIREKLLKPNFVVKSKTVETI